jgi:putative endonuclease
MSKSGPASDRSAPPWWKRLLGRNRSHEPTGRAGENLAARFLKKSGYRILHRNLIVVDDEADIVAVDPDGRTVVIIEVKSRLAGNDQTLPEERVGPMKQGHLTRMALRLQKQRRFRDSPFRFDVIAVEFPSAGVPVIRHLVNAFDSAW